MQMMQLVNFIVMIEKYVEETFSSQEAVYPKCDLTIAAQRIEAE